MKKLTNVSPFLLLLVPVFVMMIFAVSMTSNEIPQEEMAATTSTSVAGTIVKAAATMMK